MFALKRSKNILCMCVYMFSANFERTIMNYSPVYTMINSDSEKHEKST